MLGLARSGYDIPEEYYQNYYSMWKVTLNSKASFTQANIRNIQGWRGPTAIGKDPTDVTGYNLLEPLGIMIKPYGRA